MLLFGCRTLGDAISVLCAIEHCRIAVEDERALSDTEVKRAMEFLGKDQDGPLLAEDFAEQGNVPEPGEDKGPVDLGQDLPAGGPEAQGSRPSYRICQHM